MKNIVPNLLPSLTVSESQSVIIARGSEDSGSEDCSWDSSLVTWGIS